jgi:hypothetical protein
MRSISFLFFSWALVQHANADCDNGNWAVLLLRSSDNEADCTPNIVNAIDKKMEACVSSASGGKLKGAGHRYSYGNVRRLLANPEPRKLLRTAPLQQERQLKCYSCDNCQTHFCRIMEAGGAAPYCTDSCGGGTCTCTRRLESGNDEDNQDQRKLASRKWYEEQMTERCKLDLKAYAEELIEDKSNYCLGGPELLDVTAYCVE